MKKIDGKIEWSLPKNQVETELGKKINDDEFILFSEYFQKFFQLQFETTLESLGNNWEQMKNWEI